MVKKTEADQDEPDSPGKGRHFTRFLAYWGAVGLIWLIIGVFGMIGWYAMELPDVQSPEYAQAPSSKRLGVNASL